MSDRFGQFDEVMELRTALSEETDRGCALHGASYLENELGLMLSSYFVDDARIHSELLEGTGGLATFSARIAVAFALGLIPPAVRRDLDLIRKIRNDFGHNPTQIGFDHEPIANRCHDLYFRWEPLDRPPRRFFENSVFAVAAHVHAAEHRAKRPTTPKDIVINDEVRSSIRDTATMMLSLIQGEEGT